MVQAVLHIDDTRIALATPGTPADVCYAEPAFCWINGNSMTTGEHARRVQRKHPRLVKDRYVYRLSTEPLADTRFDQLTPADLLAEQLEHAVAKSPSPITSLVLATPGYMATDNLGVLLGVCQALSLPVRGLVDASVAAVRSEAPERAIVQVNLGLHAAVVSSISVSGGSASLVRHEVLDGHGVLAIRNNIATAVAAAFVKQSRFDPLHDAESEQLLDAQLDTWFAAIEGRDELVLELPFAGTTHQATLAGVDFMAAFSAHYQRIADSIRAAYGSGQPLLVQLGAGCQLPGIEEFIQARTGSIVMRLPVDATIDGALARRSEIESTGAGQLVTQLPLDQAPLKIEPVATERSAQAPTHLLVAAEAHPIGLEPISIGTGSQAGSRRITVEGATAGVSQNHCAVRFEGEHCVVTDHSRYGTFLNGHAISGSAVLQSGDILRVGTPGEEFRLIRVHH